MKFVMNIQFKPPELSESESESEDEELMECIKNTIEDFQPIVEEIGDRIDGIKTKLEGYEDDLLNKMVTPVSPEFKAFWASKCLSPAVPFQTVFLTILSMAESLDLQTRAVRFNKDDADRFAKGVRSHSIFTLIPIIIAGTSLLS
jgi:archaellum component FlaC